MRKIINLCFVFFVCFNTSVFSQFIENNGQILDWDENLHPEVQYLYGSDNNSMFFESNRVVCTFSSTDKFDFSEYEGNQDAIDSIYKTLGREVQRIDIEFIGAASDCKIVAGEKNTNYINYFLNKRSSITNVGSYQSICYKNIYPNIDIVFNQYDGGLKYDVVLHTGANIEDVKIKYNGAHSLELIDGKIKIETKFYDFEELIPEAYYNDNREEKAQVYYELTDDIISFKCDYKNINKLVIDPTITWMTYFETASSSGQISYDHNTSDEYGNLFISGYCNNSANDYPTVSPGGTAYVQNYTLNDLYIVRFNSDRELVWGTYFGGSNSSMDWQLGTEPLVVHENILHVVGDELASNGPFLNGGGFYYNPGSTKPYYARFDKTTGELKHCTNIPGHTSSHPSIAVSSSGQVAIILHAYDWGVIASHIVNRSGAYNQSTNGGYTDMFLMLLNSSFNQIWGTFLGGPGTQEDCHVAFDNSNNIFFVSEVSWSSSTSNASNEHLINPGGGAYYQSANASEDIMIGKFSNTGALAWNTLYGGNAYDGIRSRMGNGTNIVVNKLNEIVVLGGTNSDNLPLHTMSGAYNKTAPSNVNNSGGSFNDFGSFILKFSNNGLMQWATYWGGDPSGGDLLYDGKFTSCDKFIVCARTNSYTTIPLPGHYNKSSGGQSYLMQFDENYAAEWSSYIGNNTSTPHISFSAFEDRLYLTTCSYSQTETTVNPGGGAYYDGSFVGPHYGSHTIWEFNIIPTPIISGDTDVCQGESAVLSASGGVGSTYYWYNSQTGGTLLHTGATYTTPPLTSDVTYWVSSSNGSCTSARVPIIVTVTPFSAPTSVTVSPSSVCSGTTTNIILTASGGDSGSGAVVEWFTGGCGNTLIGTGNPLVISQTFNSSTTYYARYSGDCGTTSCQSTVVDVSASLTPTFAAVGPYCPGDAIPALPTTSTNGITGTWAPAINNTATTNYTFTPDPDQCALTTTLTITISGTITPTFTQLGPFCVGDTPAALPGTSTNGVTGTWSPATISTATDGTTVYTFTPTAGLCAVSTTMSVVVNICCPTATCPANINLAACNQALPAGANTLPDFVALGGTYTNATSVSYADVTVNGCSTVTTRTYSVSNGTCTVTCDQIITRVVDVTIPTITGSLTPIAQAGCSAADVPAAVNTVAALEAMGVAISDNCTADGSLTVSSSDGAPSGSCPWTITRTYTITDACGNASTVNQTITIDDTQAPVIAGSLTAINQAGCSAAGVPAAVNTVAALEAMGVAISDNCTADGSLVVTVSDGAPSGSCPWTITRTYTITDACGNASTVNQTITIDDTQAPVIAGSLTAINQAGCSAAGVPAAVNTVAALEAMGVAISDNCTADGSLVVTVSDGAPSGSCPWTITRTYIITDACGNASTSIQTITVDDNIAPVITGTPAAISYTCSGDVPVASIASVTATDNCAGIVTVTVNDVTTPGTCANNYTITRTWTAEDVCGNTSASSQIITVDDNIAPVINGTPADISYTCSGDVPVASIASVTATDNCAGIVTVTVNDVTTPGTCANNYTITRTWTATDVCGNSSTSSQTITVDDNIAPVITGTPADVTFACSEEVPVADIASVSASDNCAGVVDVVVNDVITAGTCANNYIITRTWTAEDVCGNIATSSQIITVDDNIAPVITGTPADISYDCSGDVPVASTASVTATDNCAGVVDVVVNDVITAGTCANNYTITRTWTATDVCGNSSTSSQTITVDDNIAPVITGTPAAISYTCSGDVPVASIASVTATDNCAGIVTVTVNDVTTPGTCANNYTITRTWTATDVCGNSSTSVQTITVDDNVPPTINGTPADITYECSGAVPVADIASVTATDNCSGIVNVSVDDVLVAGTCVNNYTLTRTWTATDVCGNSSTSSQIISVNDDVAPTINGTPADITYECSGAVPAADIASVTATDNCVGIVNVSVDDVLVAGTCANNYTITRTWTATDVCGNSSTSSQIISVNDDVAPTINGTPADITYECSGAVPAADIASVTAIDNCVGTVDVTVNDVITAGTCVNNYTLTRIWTATDVCGNSSTSSQIITVSDNVAPTIIGTIADQEAMAMGNCEYQVPDVSALVSSTDNCTAISSLTITQSPLAGTIISANTVVTISVSDECGNTSTTSVNITVPADPVITLISGPTCAPNLLTYYLSLTVSSGTVTATGGTVTNTSGNNWNVTGVNVPDNVTLTVTDANGCTETLVVTAPDCSCPTIPVATNPQNQEVCEGTANPALSVDNPGSGYQVNWYDSEIGGIQLAINSTTYTSTETSAGVHTYYAEVEESVNGCVSIRIPVTLTIHANPTISGTLNMCHGSDTPLTGSGMAHAVTPWTSSNANTTVDASGNVSGVTVGSSVITYMDENGCTTEVTVNVIENELPSFTQLGPYCLNSTAASLPTTSINGYTGTWLPASIGTSAAGTQTYTFTPTAGQCATTASMDVEIIAIDLNLTSTNPSCYGENGSIGFTASGGSGSYTYTVNGSSATSPHSAIAGSYTVVVSDGTCSASQNVSLTEPDLLDAYYASTNVTCNGGNNGTINVTVEGGTSSYSFAWSDGNVTTEDRSGLALGTYSVVVTDANGCSVTISNIGITQPSAISITGVITHVSCYNGSNGGVVTTTSGGNTGTYTYSWSSSQQSGNISGVIAGTYFVTATDSQGCTGTSSFVITQPDAISISSQASHPTCNAGTNGGVVLTVIGGSPNYTYQWNPAGIGGSGTPNLSGAGAGTYNVTVTDSHLCTSTATYILTEPTAISVIETIVNMTCDLPNGSISLDISGGTPQYTYQWDAAAQNATTSAVSNLTNQDYSVTVTDANQCTIEETIVVGRDIPPTLSLVEQINETCSDSNAVITVEVMDGSPLYTYEWSVDLGHNSPTISDIAAGNHVVILTDADGCVDSLTIVITNHEAQEVGIAAISPAHCDQPDGGARLEVSGGSGSYTYDWGTSPPRTSIHETELTGIQYTVTVSDGVCDVEVIVDVPNLPGPSVNASANPNEVSVSKALIRFDDGSTGATSWYWDYGTGQYSQEQTPSFKYEVPGTYNVVLTATDEYGCSTSDTVIVIVHESLEVWIPDAFSPNGDGLNDLFGPVARGMSSDGYEMVIIDRWGKEAFYTNDYFHRWDGTINGQRVEMNTVFIYRIKIRDIMGKEYGYSGRVSLIYGFE